MDGQEPERLAPSQPNSFNLWCSWCRSNSLLNTGRTVHRQTVNALGLVGLGVDASTGAINEYSHTVEVPMDPAGSSIPQYPPTRIPGTAAPNS